MVYYKRYTLKSSNGKGENVIAKCPKCSRRLHIYNISQYCPDCGVNMRFFGFEERFFREAKVAELSQAGIHIKIKRLKASFIGSRLCIARLIVMLLPVAALLLPNGNFTVEIPFKSVNYAFSVLGVYTMFTDGGFNFISSKAGSDIIGGGFTGVRNALFVYASVALFAVLVLLLSILCFISYKNMQKIIAGISAVGFADSLVALFVVNGVAGKVSENPMLTAQKGFGLILAAVMFALVFAVNFMLVKKGIPVEYDEGMEERARIYKEVKAGKINIDDLPQPVVETAQTRKIDEEIAKEEQKHSESRAKAEASENG